MQEVDSPLEKFKLLIQQHNEHRIIVPRLLTWLDYQIEGKINWPTLIMIGNLLWVSVLWFFWKGFKSRNAPIWMFIPVPWILLQPQYYDNVTWSISILQQSVIIFWYGLFCYLCAKKQFRWALVIAIIATFTHGNGIFSFLIGIVFLAIDRNWKGVLSWVLVLALVAIIYFWGFEKGQNADFQNSLSDPLRLVMAFFAFFGALTKVQFVNNALAVACGGMFVLVLAVYLLPRITAKFSTGKELTFFDRLLLGNVLFLGITAALVCVSRSWAGIENVLAPRYQHYSPFVACWAYLVLLSFLNGRAKNVLAAVFVGGAFVFNGLCYFVYNEDVMLRKNWLTADAKNWQQNGVFLNYAASFNNNIADPYSKAVQRGICSPEITQKLMSSPITSVDSTISVTVEKRIVADRDASGTYPREYMTISNKLIAGATYLYLESGAKGYWLPTRLANTGIRKLLATREIYQPGFSIEFMTENLPEGRYRVGLHNEDRFFWINNTIEITR